MAITSLERVARKLSLNWGVIPVLCQGEPADDACIEFAIAVVRELAYADSGDNLIITAGHHQQAGGTDMIRVVAL